MAARHCRPYSFTLNAGDRCTQLRRREDVVMDEAELVTRFAAGEPGSAAEVYRAYGRLVYAVTYRVLGDAGLAERATRKTFLQAWRLAAQFDPGSGLGPWLAGIAGGTAIDIERRHRHPAAVAEPESAGGTDSTVKVHDAWLVRRALDALSAQERELIRLQHHGRLSPTEISDRLAIPLERVRSESHRAHRRFAGLLRELRGQKAAM